MESLLICVHLRNLRIGFSPSMTLRRLRLLTIITPVVIVLTLEILRILTIGETSFRTRLILDGLVAIGFILFGFVMVRAISDASKRQRRQNAELLALHGAGLDVTAELSLDAGLN